MGGGGGGGLQIADKYDKCQRKQIYLNPRFRKDLPGQLQTGLTN